MSEMIRKPLMSGHCAHMPRTSEAGRASHERCHRQGGGQRANPAKEFQPCPCVCHYENDEGELELYECGGCGRSIVEAPLWPFDFTDNPDGDLRYTHIDVESGRALGEDCEPEPRRVSRNTEPKPEREKNCVRCGDAFTGDIGHRICRDCRAADEAEEDTFDDLADLDEDDILSEFADLADLD